MPESHSSGQRRREVLKMGIGVVSSGAALTRVPSATAQQAGGEVTVENTGDSQIRLSNGEVHVELREEHLEANLPTMASAAGPADGTDLTGPLDAVIKSPATSTTSPRPKFEQLEKFSIVRDEGDVAAYEVVRRHTVAGDSKSDQQPIEVGYVVTLFAGAPYFVTRHHIQNVSNTELKLDQDSGDIHDGIQLLHNIQLNGRSGASEYRFHVAGDGTHQFNSAGTWRPYPATDRVTVFDDTTAFTVGFLSGSSDPEMVITDQDPVDDLDYLVAEQTLAPGETRTYTTMQAVHGGGTSAPSTGGDLTARAKNENPTEAGRQPISQQSGEQTETKSDEAEQNDGVSVFERFGDDELPLGMGVGALGVLGAGGYVGYRRYQEDSETGTTDQHQQRSGQN